MLKYFEPGSENYIELVFMVIFVLLCESQCAYDIVRQILSHCPFMPQKHSTLNGGEGVEGGDPL